MPAPVSGVSPLSGTEDCDQSIGVASTTIKGTIVPAASRKKHEFRLHARMGSPIFNIRDAENQKQSLGVTREIHHDEDVTENQE